MTASPLPWLSPSLNQFAKRSLASYPLQDSPALIDAIEALGRRNRKIHEQECLNLNPATNIMNPRAEAMLAAGIGSRPSLGHPGDKYEMGLEAIEQIELLATALACEIFAADFAEIRVGSGALANLYAFMATCKPGDAVIVPPASIGGHVTHDRKGAAGLYGLAIHHAPVDGAHYSLDIEGLRRQAHKVRPKLITVGGSLNLLPHPVAAVREIADEVGAAVLFDAAHQCGMIAGKYWENPLDQGADLMTMSTYKSLGGPPGGLIVSNNARLMERIDAIAFPGLTANFDAAKSAALAITLLDWRDFGRDYATAMVKTSKALAQALAQEGLPLFRLASEQATDSHQFALEAARFGGGQQMARQLRQANLLSCGIGLPLPEISGDMNGLRLGTPELVRTGMNATHMPEVARYLADSLLARRSPEAIAADVSALRKPFQQLHFVHV
ncbi:MAG: aminotransferase class I/II-fold pyridoxal phosphate-dependent enzyme [Thiothrix sp.]|nr:aminotransferase class I/II-fold pyridoxal phosphate-dependent enzyme [Thiothrix sp.]HPE60730.1 aminotransferase class I/II-fold pyridoxal phosphate-dependent enzyme [Thiolinea sp.]